MVISRVPCHAVRAAGNPFRHSTTMNTTKRFLLCVTLNETDDPVATQAIDLAKGMGAALEVLHVVAPEPDFVGYTAFMYPGRDERAEELRKEKSALAALVDHVKESGLEVTGYMKEASTVAGILEFAEKHGHAMIVLGTHTRGIVGTLLMGSVATDVVKKSKIPVVVVPPSAKE